MKKVIFALLLIALYGCDPYKNSWWSPAMPHDGALLYVLKLKDPSYKNYLIVDIKDSMLVYQDRGDGGCYKYKDNAGFGYNLEFSEDTKEEIDICLLRDSSFLYPLHGDYYIIYPLAHGKYAPMSHRVTNIAWGDICNYDKDTMQLMEYPYQIPQFQVTERMVRESLHKTKENDVLTYTEVFDYINNLIDGNALESTCSKVYFTESGGYSFWPIE